MPSESHIIPVLVGDPQRCKAISDELLLRFAIYVQPINYPTVPRGTERLRLIPTPLHSDQQIERLVTALTKYGTARRHQKNWSTERARLRRIEVTCAEVLFPAGIDRTRLAFRRGAGPRSCGRTRSVAELRPRSDARSEEWLAAS